MPESKMKYIGVFCGSAKGNDSIFCETARQIGKALLENGYGIVFGGGNTGLMGALADAAIETGTALKIDNYIIGVVTTEIVTLGSINSAIKLQEEKTYLDRKANMAALSSGFIALPGGLGTLDEWVEMAINNQFASYENKPENPVKPLCLLNINGFYDGLLKQLDVCIENGFIPEKQRDMIFSGNSVEEVIDYLKNYKDREPDATRWWEH